MPELFEIFIALRLDICCPRMEFSICVEVKWHWDLGEGKKNNFIVYVILLSVGNKGVCVCVCACVRARACG